MFRRFSAALIGLALCLPVLAAPVAAHGPTSFVVDYDELANDTLVGTVTNHTTSRRFNVTVTATWENGATDITATAIVQMSNLAPHAASAFVLDPVPDVSTLGAPTVTANGAITGTKPAGALQVNPAGFTGDSYTGSIDNEGAAIATGVTIFAARLNGGVYEEIASDVVGDIPIGGNAAFSIDFSAAGSGTEVAGVIARTTGAGPFYTSWNNYFGDLGNISESFVSDVIWLAETGITTGCGEANFCPTSGVTRAQMAVFLDRALAWPDAAPTTQFTDIGTQSDAFKQAIYNLVDQGVTNGCAADKFCPNATVTRGQMSKFLILAYNQTPEPCAEEDAPCSFTDDEGHFSEQYNEAMATLGITTGCGTNVFCPNSAVLRAQMARFLRLASEL